MNKKVLSVFLVLCFTTSYICIAEIDVSNESQYSSIECIGEYGIQWMKNYGPDQSGGRYEGPQPIGDCDGDGDNEVLIGGRDAKISVMEWNSQKQIYEETHSLHSPFYYFFLLNQMLNPEARDPPNAGGFAIGDLTGDGKNEIAATWYTTVYKWIAGQYRIIGFNPWIFQNGGGNADCYIGDCDNDGQNELIMSGGPTWYGNEEIPEIVIFKWNGWRLVKVAEWDDPGISSYVYMAGLGDVDEDGENEIVCCSAGKVIVLNWNKETKEFESVIIEKAQTYDSYPFSSVCKDSDNDGKDEIHIGNNCGYNSPDIGKLTIFEWNGTGYEKKFEKEWPGEEGVIESLDVGDVDGDGIPEVCVGTNIVHILQWNGTTYVEEALLDQTHGFLAVLNIGDCDNDGENEINVAPVYVDNGQDYVYWIFKYGWESK